MKTIVIDPGHGGPDPGAVGRYPYKIREADVVWAVSVLVISELEEHGFSTAMTRNQSESKGITRRARGANDEQADAVVSIHCNSWHEPTAGGVETLHYPGSVEGVRLSQAIMAAMSGPMHMFGITNRGLKERPRLGILRMTNAPASLVELPFISNPSEARLLVDSYFQITFGKAIAQGVINWAETKE